MLWWRCKLVSRLLPVNGPMHVVRRRRAHDAGKIPFLPWFFDAVDVVVADLLTDSLSCMHWQTMTSAHRDAAAKQVPA